MRLSLPSPLNDYLSTASLSTPIICALIFFLNQGKIFFLLICSLRLFPLSRVFGFWTARILEQGVWGESVSSLLLYRRKSAVYLHIIYFRLSFPCLLFREVSNCLVIFDRLRTALSRQYWCSSGLNIRPASVQKYINDNTLHLYIAYDLFEDGCTIYTSHNNCDDVGTYDRQGGIKAGALGAADQGTPPANGPRPVKGHRKVIHQAFLQTIIIGGLTGTLARLPTIAVAQGPTVASSGPDVTEVSGLHAGLCSSIAFLYVHY